MISLTLAIRTQVVAEEINYDAIGEMWHDDGSDGRRTSRRDDRVSRRGGALTVVLSGMSGEGPRGSPDGELLRVMR